MTSRMVNAESKISQKNCRCLWKYLIELGWLKIRSRKQIYQVYQKSIFDISRTERMSEMEFFNEIKELKKIRYVIGICVYIFQLFVNYFQNFLKRFFKRVKGTVTRRYLKMYIVGDNLPYQSSMVSVKNLRRSEKFRSHENPQKKLIFWIIFLRDLPLKYDITT